MKEIKKPDVCGIEIFMSKSILLNEQLARNLLLYEFVEHKNIHKQFSFWSGFPLPFTISEHVGELLPSERLNPNVLM